MTGLSESFVRVANLSIKPFDMITEQVATRTTAVVERPPSPRTFEHAATINTGILSVPVPQVPIPDPVVVEPEQCYQILTTFRSMHLPSLGGLS